MLRPQVLPATNPARELSPRSTVVSKDEFPSVSSDSFPSNWTQVAHPQAPPGNAHRVNTCEVEPREACVFRGRAPKQVNL